MLEKLKAKADSGSKMAEMALKDESISLNAGLPAVDKIKQTIYSIE